MEVSAPSWSAKPQYAPLLWVLIPLVLAIICAKYFQALAVSIQLGCAGTALCVCVLGYWRRWPDWMPSLGIAVMAFIVFWAYADIRKPDADPRLWAPPREIVAQIRIEQCYAPSLDGLRERGLGRIVQAEPPLDYLVGQRVVFALIGGGVQVGEQWSVQGIIEHLKQDSFGKSMKLGGIYYTLRRGRLNACTQLASGFDRICNRAQQHLQSIVTQHLGPVPVSSLGTYAAMLLGKTSLLSAEQKNAFRLSGTLHLFAISGLHIAVIAAFLFWCLKRLPVPEVIRVLIGLQIIAAYVIVTGSAPSAWRAFWMVALFWAGVALQRQTTPFAVLVAAATGVLLWNPILLWNIGFQLSYMVVAGIIVYGLPLASYLGTYKEEFADPVEQSRWIRARCALARTVAITLSANIASIPLIIIHFGLFSVVGFGLNLLLVPLASAAIVLGFLSLSIGALGFSWVCAGINTMAIWLLAGLEQVVYQSVKIPGSTFVVIWTQLWGSLVLGGLWVIWLILPPRPGSAWKFWLAPAWCLIGVLGQVIWR